MTCLGSHSHEVGSTCDIHTCPRAMASLWATCSKSAPTLPTPHLPLPSAAPGSQHPQCFVLLPGRPPPPPRLSPPPGRQPGCCLSGSRCQAVSSFHRPKAARGSASSSLGTRPLRPLPACSQTQTPAQRGGHPAPSPRLQQGRVTGGPSPLITRQETWAGDQPGLL